MREYFTEWHNQYFNCRFWYAGRLHAFFYATFRPSHANKNLKGEL